MTRTLLVLLLWAAGAAAAPRQAAIPVGWHDEMNTTGAWRHAGGQEPDLLAHRPGAMTLRLPHVPDGFPYSYQWGTVTRDATVDLARYPMMVARVSRFAPNTYAHLDIEQKDYAGRPARTLRTDTLTEPGLIVYDLGAVYGPYTWRFAIRLAVGGANAGACCEFDWVRFVRREDVPLLKTHPDWQKVVLQP